MATKEQVLAYFKDNITEENYKSYLKLLNLKSLNSTDALKDNENQKAFINLINAMVDYKVLDVYGALSLIDSCDNITELNSKLDSLNPNGKAYSELDLDSSIRNAISAYKTAATKEKTLSEINPIIKQVNINSTEFYGYTSIDDYNSKYVSLVLNNGYAPETVNATINGISGLPLEIQEYLTRVFDGIYWRDVFVRKNNLSCFADTRVALIRNIVNFELNGERSTEIGNALAAKLAATNKTPAQLQSEILGYYNASGGSTIDADSLVYNVNMLYIIKSVVTSDTRNYAKFETLRDAFREIINKENEKLIYNS